MFKKLGLTSLSLGLIVSLVACGGGSSLSEDISEQDLQKLVFTSLEKWQEADSSAFEATISGSVQMEATEYSEAQDVVLDLEMNGSSEVLDKETSEMNFSFDTAGTLTMDGNDIEFAVEMMGVDGTAYMNLAELSGLENIEEAAMVAPMVEGYLGKWWSYDLPADTFADLNPEFPGLDEEEALTEEEQALQDLYESTSFFSEIKVSGSEKVAGVMSDRIEFVLDKEAVMNYEIEAAEIEGFPMSESEIADQKAALEAMEIEATIWIAQEEKYLTRVEGTLKGDVEEEGLKVDLNFDLVLKDYNKKMSYSAPKDATEFDLGSLLGMPAGGMDYDMYGDMDMDMYGDIDMGDYDFDMEYDY